MSEDDPIKRAAELPPPTITDAILLHCLAEWVSRRPERLEAVRRRAHDKVAIANVIALHGKTGDAGWEEAFRGAAIRLDSVAAMLRAEMEAKPPKRRKRK